MPLFQTILVAAGFSESSREAFRVACSFALRQPPSLHPAYPLPPGAARGA